MKEDENRKIDLFIEQEAMPYGKDVADECERRLRTNLDEWSQRYRILKEVRDLLHKADDEAMKTHGHLPFVT